MAKRYGDWEIVRGLNEGGQAHIFLVKNFKDGRQGVLKRLKNVDRVERFKSEFKVMEAGDPSFFPTILAADIDGDSPYFVMEYFRNGALCEELTGPWTLEERVRFYLALITAVVYANEQGVIHRDLKPGNILVSDDKLPRVTDFGICYIDDRGERQTLVDEAVGSFRFMAPEMEDGRVDKVGQQTDIYSLGKIAYWLFTGRIYNRERHREPQFDLSKQGAEPWRHYFNDFLDKVTNPDPDARLGKTELLLNEFEVVRRAMQENIRYLDLAVEQECAFCKIGKYRIAVDGLDPQRATAVHNFGFVPVGAPQWLIFTCDRCGNVQAFRKDFAKNWSWKTKD